MKKEIKPEYEVIHQVLHDKNMAGIQVGEKFFPVQISKLNKCRYIDYDSVRFMEQNPRKQNSKGFTEGALAAQQGAKITWGIWDGEWLKIEG